MRSVPVSARQTPRSAPVAGPCQTSDHSTEASINNRQVHDPNQQVIDKSRQRIASLKETWQILSKYPVGRDKHQNETRGIPTERQMHKRALSSDEREREAREGAVQRTAPWTANARRRMNQPAKALHGPFLAALGVSSTLHNTLRTWDWFTFVLIPTVCY